VVCVQAQAGVLQLRAAVLDGRLQALFPVLTARHAINGWLASLGVLEGTLVRSFRGAVRDIPSKASNTSTIQQCMVSAVGDGEDMPLLVTVSLLKGPRQAAPKWYQ
jgi:hypothetical protein